MALLHEAEVHMPDALSLAGGNDLRSAEQAALDFVKAKGRCLDAKVLRLLQRFCKPYEAKQILEGLIDSNRLRVQPMSEGGSGIRMLKVGEEE